MAVCRQVSGLSPDISGRRSSGKGNFFLSDIVPTCSCGLPPLLGIKFIAPPRFVKKAADFRLVFNPA
jgi:hypothetical protein